MKGKNILNLILISCSVLFVGISLSLITPFYPSEALSKGVSVTQSGLVMGSVFITTIILTPIFGKYIQILGAKKVLIIGSFIVGLGNFMFGFLVKVQDTNTFFALSILIRVIIAVGESAVAPSAYVLAGKQVSKKNQGKTLAAVEACFGVGTMFGPTVGGCLYDLGGFSLPFWVSGVIMMFVSCISVLFFKNVNSSNEDLVNHRKVSWVEILKAPGVLISSFALAFAGAAWCWYAASLEPFLNSTYGLSSSQTGLVFMAFGLTYTVFTPIFGFLTDEGLDGLIAILIGNWFIAIGFIFLGPIPPLHFLGSNLWLTVLSIGLQGLGSAATYLGTLLYMMKSMVNSGFPESEQTTGMVSSLWVVSDCAGSALGSALGSVAYDMWGFKRATLVMAWSMIGTVVIVGVYFLTKVDSSKRQNNLHFGKEETKVLLTED